MYVGSSCATTARQTSKNIPSCLSVVMPQYMIDSTNVSTTHFACLFNYWPSTLQYHIKGA